MKYIWGIYNIYMTPSAILFFPNVLRPSLPPDPPNVLRVPSPDPRTSYVFPPPIPEGLTCSLPRIAQTFIRGP